MPCWTTLIENTTQTSFFYLFAHVIFKWVYFVRNFDLYWILYWFNIAPPVTLLIGLVSCPPHWPTKQSKVQKIQVDGNLYFDLLIQFFDSVKAVVEVENITEIINHDLFERYLR